MATCSKCEEPSERSLLVRKGEMPDPHDPKMKNKDKSSVNVLRFCAKHWDELDDIFK